tara:strand:+ start:962 stop:1654 length:693 start_codon:yes stop_codon:yes gene_type:complete
MYYFIFYHIPKCGGSSIREFCKNLFINSGYNLENIYIAAKNQGRPNIMSENILNNIKYKLENKKIILSHINTKLYNLLPSKYNITCIRNPITRFFSNFNHFILSNNSNYNLEDLFINNINKFNEIGVYLIYYNSNYFINDNKSYDFIIIFENLNNDLKKLNKNINSKIDINIPHINPGKDNIINKNYFKFNINNKIHNDIVDYLKIKLKKDIDIYNNICINRKLNEYIIK